MLGHEPTVPLEGARMASTAWSSTMPGPAPSSGITLGPPLRRSFVRLGGTRRTATCHKSVWHASGGGTLASAQNLILDLRVAGKHDRANRACQTAHACVARCGARDRLGACSAAAGGHATTTSVSTTSTTSTTTTLPEAVPGTSFLRARVAALAPGANAPDDLTPSSAAWLKMVPIAYQTLGSGPDLLLIAGQDATMSWWDPSLLSDLSSHFRVTLFDLPGAG